ncbi:MAG: DNA internalization-related competence protein ComEC/Rec2 [Butyrivibrio sp.]|nr:DNA internalization-related competence protein ComEC/Rec2 [Butyrivibrio sp.]
MRKRRVSYFYLVFPFLLIAGYILTLFASRESSLVRVLAAENKRECEILGTVRKIQRSDSGYKITLKKVTLLPDGERLEDCVAYTKEAYETGALLRISGTAALFDTAENPGEFDTRSYYRTMKIGFAMYPDEVVCEKSGSAFLPRLAGELSERLRTSLYSITDSESAGVLAAMLLGERDGLDSELSDLFSECGIGHILAISGLHVSLIGMGLYKLLRKCGIGYTVSMLIGSAVILFYAMMTGNGTSTVRAVIMYIAAVYANAAGRAYDMLSALSLAALIMLLGNPLLLHNAGFLLSFGAVLGIALIAKNVSGAFNITKKIPSALVTSLSVQAVTLPVIMHNYYEVPTLSVLINLLVVPLMSVVMISALFGGLAGLWSVYAGRLLTAPAAAVIRLYKLLCAAYLRLPWAVWICGEPKPWQTVLYYLLLAAVVFALKKYDGKRKFPALGFVPTLIALMLRFDNGFEADFLYVGQGDGIFIRSGNGSAILIDGGSSDKRNLYEYTLEPFLMSKGVARLSCAVVTHCDADHISGLKALLEKGKIKVDTVYMPDIGFSDEAYVELWEIAESSGAEVSTIYCGILLTAGSTELACLHPQQGGADGDRNGSSTVLAVRDGDFSMLLTGDVGEEQERTLCEAVSGFAPFDVLKAAHHGSKFSNSEEFILAARPKSIVISCGKDNLYGHPHEEALERMGEFGAVIYRTDEQGAVVFGG